MVRRSQPLLGTFVTITAYAPEGGAAHAAVSAAFDEFRRIDARMSIHRKDSELSRLNARAAQEPVEASLELFKVIAKAQEIAGQTEGSFDITIRPLADLWGFILKEYRLPNVGELRSVLPHVDFRLVQLDSRDCTVRFLSPGVSLDLGGIAKGHAVDRAIERLQAMGISNAMVKAGGDLRVIGAPPGRTHWIVQLEDAHKRGRRTSVRLRDAALSTSGNYENFFEIDGRRYAHILDPRTGFPVQGVAACSVIAPRCIESDALATACIVYGVHRSFERFGNRFPMRFTLASDQSGTHSQILETRNFRYSGQRQSKPPQR